MAIHLAVQTIKAIEEGVRKDQGSAYRGWLGKVLPHIGDAYRTDEDGFRSHMGASLIGGECARSIWYNFRWASKSSFSGQMIRLFNRGHLEEGRFIAALLMIGVQIYQQDENGKQFRINHADGHFGGSGDGIGVGIPDLKPGMPCLTEYKTHNEKSFHKLAGDNWRDYVEHLLDPNKPAAKFTGEGVREAKFEHYVQMNVYMRKMGIPIALYGAVNKNTDELYWELVPLNTELADEFLDRGAQLVRMDKPPKKLNESPGFWKCRFCDFKPVCHLKAAPARNCRTCAYSAPAVDGDAAALGPGSWVCNLPMNERSIDKSVQLVGCDHYEVKKCL
jgi:hypothetical protein